MPSGLRRPDELLPLDHITRYCSDGVRGVDLNGLELAPQPETRECFQAPPKQRYRMATETFTFLSPDGEL
ncbi:unnamed protein product [Nippostrongylus brasiliensis]|uniref:Transposase n=1 Tax=Nippostrongylus brasiliensis TaxID=27835 RepID=A0A0N4Y7V8_NIPBR|nr:hypothetical protein Q1695_014615 [Nippostrongylus brasiliensis]VDL75857.1 unnamed protein product [Nippostrongylus brasiliensis]